MGFLQFLTSSVYALAMVPLFEGVRIGEQLEGAQAERAQRRPLRLSGARLRQEGQNKGQDLT